ncbi:hypothetical protein FGO68_gene7946 [Halteria grandinella]|uniref:Uncharacterized protein n=1 Tax=Halteria grandinella TaxID=5974 RepID=A0A8J8SUV5_HALGN|nr:hypothetical protein FGO68_gene7946 [Halteria grandinella]
MMMHRVLLLSQSQMVKCNSWFLSLSLKSKPLQLPALLPHKEPQQLGTVVIQLAKKIIALLITNNPSNGQEAQRWEERVHSTLALIRAQTNRVQKSRVTPN